MWLYAFLWFSPRRLKGRKNQIVIRIYFILPTKNRIKYQMNGHKEHEEFRAKIKIDFRSIKLKCGEAIENEKIISDQNKNAQHIEQQQRLFFFLFFRQTDVCLHLCVCLCVSRAKRKPVSVFAVCGARIAIQNRYVWSARNTLHRRTCSRC